MQSSKYVVKPVDNNGFVKYEASEHAVWQQLFKRQVSILQGRACDEFLKGLNILQMPPDRIPQLTDLNEKLFTKTKFTLAPVPALIPTKDFFQLLAQRKFPVATFIRTPEEIDYVEEPDIFHELFGHCPLLTHPAYADFVHAYGELSLQATPEIQESLARLFFFTIEVGLIQTKNGLRIYGGGILSSSTESVYALESPLPERLPFNLQQTMHHSFRLDIPQKIYYVIDGFEMLYDLLKLDLLQEAALQLMC